MRVLIYGLNFSPELTGVGKYTGELVEWLIARGHDVRVVTAPPYYPGWKIPGNYSAWHYKWDGKNTIRCPIWVPANPSAITRIVHLVSFAISSFPMVLAQARWRPEVVWLVVPTFFCVPAALITAKLSRAPSWLHVQDFEVGAALEMGFFSIGRLRKLVESVELFLIRRFDRVSSISEKMVERLLSMGVDKGSAKLFPNWIDIDAIRPMTEVNPFQMQLKFPEGATVALYSGNMGSKQGLEILATAARLLQVRTDIKFVFCGDGAGRADLFAATAKLTNVVFLPLQPIERLNELLNFAAIHLLPQKADAADLVMPSKLTGILASGRPVVTTAKDGTQLAKVVSGRGIVVAPEDALGFANAITRLADDALLRKRFGDAAREYAITNLGREAILRDFERGLYEVVKERHATMMR